MNNNFGIYKNSFLEIINELHKYHELEKAVIFGSRAMGNYKKGSDIDIAIFGKNITFEILSKLNYELNEELPIPYFIDVIHFETTENKELQKHILTEGAVIYQRK